MGNRQGEDGRLVTRRQILRGATGLGLAAATGALLPGCSRYENRREVALPTDAPPETTSISLWSVNNLQCIAAHYMAEPFLREEGFTDVQYPRYAPKDLREGFTSGKVQMGIGYAAYTISLIETGAPLVMLGGVHVGCWHVVATGDIKSLRDFKGKTVSIISPTFTDGLFMAMTMNDVGLDMNRDVKVVNHLPSENAQILSSGEVDAVVAFPPITKDLRVKGIGRVVLNSMTDPPWSSYYCCTAVTNRDWMEQHPVAAKRALRAIIKGADVVANDPVRTARFMVERGFSDNFDYTCDILREIPYKNIWRDFDPVDGVRFYALRLKQAGLIKSTPDEILERGADFRYLNELRRELKEA
jgi:NitT/TauT family transport system substrate-binding protein